MRHRKITFFLLPVFIGGLFYIAWSGRPVNKLPAEYQNEEQADNVYALEEVARHSSPDDCWSAIGGQVYDLSSWVLRHPGGTEAIIGLCGRDGSDDFNRQHGGSNTAQAALILLKIGRVQ